MLSGNDEIYSFNLDPDASTKQPPFVNLQQYYTEWFLVERILDDVGEKPGNLPLLEFTLTQLWEKQSWVSSSVCSSFLSIP